MDEKTKQRYQRQIIFDGLGEAGQEKLLQSSVAQVGCGALGSTLAQLLVRAGVGTYAIVDPDRAEIHNLHRQSLFDEDDVKAGAKKALAAVEKLKRAVSSAKITGHDVALSPDNADELLSGHDLVVDALDNMETRLVINDWCVKNKTPWIYGAVAGASGMTMPIIPGDGPCLRCLFPDPETAKNAVNTDTAGVLNVTPATIGAIQAAEAIKLLAQSPDLCRDFRIVDLWTGGFQSFAIKRNPDCPCCGKGEYDFLG